jgi:hypothetical protein
MAEVPEQHQAGCADVESMQRPDRSDRQAEDIDRIDHVADVGQDDVPEAVRGQTLPRVWLSTPH